MKSTGIYSVLFVFDNSVAFTTEIMYNVFQMVNTIMI